MNEVAEKIEAKEEFDISLMPSDRITLVWEDCEKFLQKSCNSDNVVIELILHYILN